LISSNPDFPRFLGTVGEALRGRIPAFIRETVERAKIAAIARTKGGNIQGKVLEEDLLAAASAMETHAKMLQPKEKELAGSPELLVKVPANHNRAAKNLFQTLGATPDGVK
jgi:hypothetical protein